MEHSRKLDLFSLLVSLSLHVAILLAISINSVLSGKTYEVVNVVPISFDTEVESNLIGIKPVKGKSNGGAPKVVNSVTEGNRSFKRRGGGGAALRELKKSGVGEESSRLTSKRRSSPSTLKRNFTTGKGRGKLELSVELPKKEGKDLPSVSTSELVPYLIHVRNTIMKNWKIPYYSNAPEKRSMTVVLTLKRDGTIGELTVEKLSPDITFNRSAISAIYSVKSFGPFPKGVKEKSVRLKVKFEVK